MNRFTVIYDACVLYPAPLRDLLMHLAMLDLYRAKWTDAIQRTHYPDGYDRTSYRRAIARACKQASIPDWTPNQLRHTYATAVRRRFGLEAAQVLLGHSNADVTQVYAERDIALAERVAREVG